MLLLQNLKYDLCNLMDRRLRLRSDIGSQDRWSTDLESSGDIAVDVGDSGSCDVLASICVEEYANVVQGVPNQTMFF